MSNLILLCAFWTFCAILYLLDVLCNFVLFGRILPSLKLGLCLIYYYFVPFRRFVPNLILLCAILCLLDILCHFVPFRRFVPSLKLSLRLI